MFRGLQTRFTGIFVVLTVIPLLVVSALVAFISFNNLRTQAQQNLTQTSEAVADQVEGYITARTRELQLLIDSTGLPEATAESTLQNLLFRTDLYEEIALLDATGEEIVLASRFQAVQDSLSSRAEDPAFTTIVDGAPNFYSEVFFDETLREPLMTISLPLIDLRSGQLDGVLVADFRFRPIWQQLTDLELSGSTEAYIIDTDTGAVVAHPDPSVVLRNTTFIPDANDARGAGLSADDMFFGQQSFVLGERTFVSIAEQPAAEVLSIGQQLLNVTLLITALALVAAVIVVTVTVRQVVRPIRKLSDVAGQIQSGELSLRATINSDDEIGDLATSFNSMTNQMNELIDGLEDRVAARTRDLEVAADISRQVATVLLIEDLLPQLVERTRQGFDLYHTSIFLIEPDSDVLRLAASTGEAGRFMLADQQTFKLGDLGLVPTAAGTREPALALDISKDEHHRPNPMLPDTKSELALPMVVGLRLIGVLDLQSEHVNAFSPDDLRVMQSLADQFAVAVQNAKLYATQLETAEELRRLDDMKSQFLASMSHELRTPLNAILNFSQFVRSGKLGEVNERQENALTKTVESGEHLLSLINDVLDIAKIEAGMMELFVENDVDVLKELNTAVAACETIIRDKPVTLVTQLPDSVPLMVADRRRIRQIVLNLVSNACKYTNEGQVDVCLDTTENDIKLTVRDTGVGIAPAEIDLIFESFRQTADGLRQAGGTGLGLAISKQLTEQHHGSLTCVSEIGQGSTFTLSLPLRAPELIEQVF